MSPKKASDLIMNFGIFQIIGFFPNELDINVTRSFVDNVSES